MNAFNRRAFLGGVGASLTCGLDALGETKAIFNEQQGGEAINVAKLSHQVYGAAGRDFIIGLIDPELNLAPEYAGAKIHWLFHDNYLAAKILNATHPEIAARIRAAIASYGVERSGKIEILFNEAPDPLPFRLFELYDVKQVGDKLIRSERVQSQQMRGWEVYADLRFLAAIAQSKSDPARAAENADAAWALWDGLGFHDRVVDVHQRYATYKLSLGLIAAARLGRIPTGWAQSRAGAPAAYAQALDRLLAQRSQSGGWITDYNPDGTPVGLANVETTSMAVQALDELAAL